MYTQELMKIILETIDDGREVYELEAQYNEKDIYDSYARCIDRRMITSDIQYIRTLEGKVFIIRNSAIGISSIGRSFMEGHQSM